MFDNFHDIAFALKVIAFLLALIFLALVGLGVIVAPMFLARLDDLVAALRQIAAK